MDRRVEMSATATGKKLWTTKVYHRHIVGLERIAEHYHAQGHGGMRRSTGWNKARALELLIAEKLEDIERGEVVSQLMRSLP